MIPLLKIRAGKDAVGIKDKYIGNHEFVWSHLFCSEKGISADTFINNTRNTATLLCGHPKTHGNSVFVSKYDPS